MEITDQGYYINLYYGTKRSSNPNKVEVVDISRENEEVFLITSAKSFQLNWEDITIPVVSSALELEVALRAMVNNIPDAGLFAKSGSFTSNDLLDESSLSAWVLQVEDGLDNEIKTVTIIRPDGTSIPVSVTVGKIDGTDKPNWFYYDFGADPGVGTFYWLATAKS